MMIKLNTLKYYFSLVLVFIVIIWTPIQRTLLMIDGAGRMQLLLIMLAVFINIRSIIKKSIQFPIVFYLILAVYMFCNGLTHDSNLLFESGFMGYFIMFRAIFNTVFLMIVVICLGSYNFDRTLNIVTLSLLLYCVICLVNSEMTDDRLLGVMDPNQLALNAGMCFSCIILQFIRKNIPVYVFVAEASFILYLIVVDTGSRMGFAMIVVITGLSILLLRDYKSVKSLIVMLILVVVGAIMVKYVIDNTFVGERILELNDQDVNEEFTTGTVLDYLGDRGWQYYYSWPLFLKNPVYGIGFHQWINYNPIQDTVAHSEYMVEYLENGLIGFVLYLLFFVGLIIVLLKKKRQSEKKDSRTIMMFVITLISVFVSNFSLWSYDSVGVFAIYGLAYAINNKKTKCFTEQPRILFDN